MTSHRTLPLLLLLSGFSALTYQLVWLRLMGLSIGATSIATAAVIGAVFLGMALGAWAVSHLPLAWSSRLKSFALLETTVAVSALLTLPALLHLGNALAMVPEVGGQLWFRFLAATVLLSLPSAAIGASYPLLASIMVARRDSHHNLLGHLYAIHTLGAVSGVIISAFLLVPALGIDGAIYTAVAVNLLAAVLALRLKEVRATNCTTDTVATTYSDGGARLGLLAIVLTGVSAAAVQVAWTKYLAIYTGSTLYGFSLILAITLGGIAIGSSAGHAVARRVVMTRAVVVYSLLLLALALLFSRTALGVLPLVDGYLNHQEFSDATKMFARYCGVVAALGPPALLLGAIFPINLHHYWGGHPQRRGLIGRGYAANTLAGVVGAALSGLWLIPTYGTDLTLALVAAFVAAGTLAALPALDRARTSVTVLAAVAMTQLAAFWLPGLDYRGLIVGAERRIANFESTVYATEPNFLFLAEGQGSIITLVDYDGLVVLKNDALNEAHLELKRSRAEILLGLLPQLFKPAAQNAFVAGYGAGTTTKVLAASGTMKVRTVEIEPAVLEAMAFHEGGQLELLGNAAVQIEVNDARNVLLMEPRKYDVVISQPSHSWRAGSGALFSQEYFHLAHTRLNEGGVFGLWINLFQMDAATLGSVFQAFYGEYPAGVVFISNASSELLLFGSDAPLELDYEQVDARLNHPAIRPYAQAINIGSPGHILSNYYLFTRDEALAAAGVSPPTTDLNLLTETRLPWLTTRLLPEEDPLELLRRHIK